jgi:hypothetical protein
MMFHRISWGFIRFYDVLVNRSVPTETNRGLISYMYLEHSRSQQSVYKISLPSHSDSSCESSWLDMKYHVPKALRLVLSE